MRKLGGEFEILEGQKRDIDAQLAHSILTLNELKK